MNSQLVVSLSILLFVGTGTTRALLFARAYNIYHISVTNLRAYFPFHILRSIFTAMLCV